MSIFRPIEWPAGGVYMVWFTLIFFFCFLASLFRMIGKTDTQWAVVRLGLVDQEWCLGGSSLSRPDFPLIVRPLSQMKNILLNTYINIRIYIYLSTYICIQI